MTLEQDQIIQDVCVRARVYTNTIDVDVPMKRDSLFNLQICVHILREALFLIWLDCRLQWNLFGHWTSSFFDCSVSDKHSSGLSVN